MSRWVAFCQSGKPFWSNWSSSRSDDQIARFRRDLHGTTMITKFRVEVYNKHNPKKITVSLHLKMDHPQKEMSIPTIHFQVRWLLVSRRKYLNFTSPQTPRMRMLVTARMTGNIFSFGDPKLNLHLPLRWGGGVLSKFYIISGPHGLIPNFIPSPKLNSSPLQSYRTPIGKANVFQAPVFQGASCENCGVIPFLKLTVRP